VSHRREQVAADLQAVARDGFHVLEFTDFRAVHGYGHVACEEVGFERLFLGHEVKAELVRAGFHQLGRGRPVFVQLEGNCERSPAFCPSRIASSHRILPRRQREPKARRFNLANTSCRIRIAANVTALVQPAECLNSWGRSDPTSISSGTGNLWSLSPQCAPASIPTAINLANKCRGVRSEEWMMSNWPPSMNI
jgi:hypothetical protein